MDRTISSTQLGTVLEILIHRYKPKTHVLMRDPSLIMGEGERGRGLRKVHNILCILPVGDNLYFSFRNITTHYNFRLFSFVRNNQILYEVLYKEGSYNIIISDKYNR